MYWIFCFKILCQINSFSKGKHTNIFTIETIATKYWLFEISQKCWQVHSYYHQMKLPFKLTLEYAYLCFLTYFYLHCFCSSITCQAACYVYVLSCTTSSPVFYKCFVPQSILTHHTLNMPYQKIWLLSIFFPFFFSWSQVLMCVCVC